MKAYRPKTSPIWVDLTCEAEVTLAAHIMINLTPAIVNAVLRGTPIGVEKVAPRLTCLGGKILSRRSNESQTIELSYLEAVVFTTLLGGVTGNDYENIREYYGVNVGDVRELQYELYQSYVSLTNQIGEVPILGVVFKDNMQYFVEEN